MANYPVKLLKDKDGTAFIPVVNSDSIITPEGDTLNDLLEEKQDLLTSGTNIKTINNESLLGSGNISIQGGGGTTNYTDLTNKPQINGVTLSGNKTTSDLGITIPTKVSDLTNDTGFITNTTNNLTNYYTKTNTYTKTEVDQLIGAISTLNIEIVQTLPSTGSTSTIYLVPKTASTNDNYDEYIYVSNSWEHIGSTEVDLSNYYTKTQVDNLLDGKQDTLNSGTNIKTINGLSLVGAGNITTGDMLRATYDVNSNGIVDNAELVNGHSVNSDVPSNAVFTDTAAGYIHIWTDTTYSGRVNMGTDDLGLYLFPNGGYFDSLSIDKGGAVLLTEIPDHGRKFYCFDTIYQNSSSIYRLMYGSGTSYGNYRDLRFDNIVMQSRKINGHELYTDVTLDADDVGALPDDTTYVSSINNLTGDVNISVPTKVSDLTNDSGFITGITSTDVTTALGYTPYDSSNPSGYTTNTGTITGVSVNGTSVATSGVANITSVPASVLSGAIPSAVTATTQTSSDNSTKIATTAFVKTAIDNLPEPMVFKGSLGTGGTITSLPTNGTATVGDTYKVITDGTYASKAAKVGDTFICLTKTSSANTWELIPSGDDAGGTVTSITLNATSPIAIDNSSAITTSGERTISHANSGVTAGTYKSVTVDNKGHVTAGTNPTTLSGYGITDAKISNGTITLGSNTITPSTIQNIKDGSATGSVRTSNSATESTTYTIGPYAFSEGSYTKASGNASHAEGGYTKAFGANSHAEGWGSEASGNQSHAEGNATVAAGDYSHSEGYYTTANEDYSHSEGYYTTASGNYGAHSEGYRTVAEGSYSHSEGKYTAASKEGSHAEGYWARAVGKNSHAEGGWDSSVPYNIIGTVVSIDTENKTYEVSGLTRYIDSDNNYVGALYYHTSSGSNESYYISSETYDTTTNNFIFGVSSIDSSIVVGGSFYIKISSVALGDFSHSEGTNTFAIGKCSHAEGWNTTARYNGSHAEGTNTYAGPFAHAEGYYTEASGYYGAHSEGNYTEASGNSSHTEGSYTKASGNYSHAEGSYTEASGSSSHASGYYTKANRSYQTVIGKYNDNKNNTLFEVGNGTADDARSNAFVVYSDGKAEIGADPTSSMHVATKQYVDNKVPTNIKNGSTSGSIRTSQSGPEGDSYTMGECAFSEGNGTKASGNASHAEGYYTTASGTSGAHSEGSSTIASGEYSHAEGYQTRAVASTSHAEGYQTIASGNRSHAEGWSTIASGNYSHAEGGRKDGLLFSGTVVSVDAENQTYEVSGVPKVDDTLSDNTIYSGAFYSKTNYIDPECRIVSAVRSSETNNVTFTVSSFSPSYIAVGNSFRLFEGSKASGNYSHAEGYGTYAIGFASHTEGEGTIASGSSSHAGGYYTKAKSSYQTAVGKYNDNKNNTLFEVGNGTADDARSNAFVVYSDGRAELGADPTTAMGVATKQYVDNKDSGWINITASTGTWTQLRYRKVGNMVYVEGYGTFTYGGSTISFANIPIGYRPSISKYTIAAAGGKTVSRFGVTSGGNLFCDWTINVSDGSNATTANLWHNFSLQYFVD